jgi:hypothetical protein
MKVTGPRMAAVAPSITSSHNNDSRLNVGKKMLHFLISFLLVKEDLPKGSKPLPGYLLLYQFSPRVMKYHDCVSIFFTSGP